MNTALAFHPSPSRRAPRSGLPPVAALQRDPAEPAPYAAVPASWPAARRPRSFWLLVLGVHALGAWALAHSLTIHAAAPKAEPLQVRVIAPPPPPVQIQRVLAPSPSLPMVAQAPQIALPHFDVLVVVAAAPAAAPVTAAATAAAPAPATVAAGPRQLPPGAVRYLTLPQLHLPRMSLRLGESGTVLLHILVDTEGHLKSASVKKSSGFERLDQQALQDIRSARFAPYPEQGPAVEWEADAGLQYEITGR